MRAQPNYSAPALEKGLDILEALAASPEAMTLSTLAKAMERGTNEIFRMVNLLEERHFIRRDSSGAYGLSLKLFSIAHSHDPVRQLIEAAQPAMRELTQATSESCHLSVLEGHELVVLSVVECARPVRLTIAIGSRFEAFQTVSGRALLGALPEERRTAILAGSPGFQTLKQPARKKAMDSISAESRGPALTARNETVAGVLDAAVAFGNPDEGIHAAVAVSALHFPGEGGDPAGFVAALRRCAAQIVTSAGLSLDCTAAGGMI